MDIVRNCIHITGLADPDEWPVRYPKQCIQYSETEVLTISKDNPSMKSLFQVMIQMDVHPNRNIQTPNGHTVIIDGVKNIKILYLQEGSSGKANAVDIQYPFNTFIELPENVSLYTVNVHVLDACFSLLDARRIYSHYVYMLDIVTDSASDLTSEAESAIVKIPDTYRQKPHADKLPEEAADTERRDSLPEQSSSPDEFAGDNLIDLDAEHL